MSTAERCNGKSESVSETSKKANGRAGSQGGRTALFASVFNIMRIVRTDTTIPNHFDTFEVSKIESLVFLLYQSMTSTKFLIKYFEKIGRFLASTTPGKVPSPEGLSIVIFPVGSEGVSRVAMETTDVESEFVVGRIQAEGIVFSVKLIPFPIRHVDTQPEKGKSWG